MQDYDIYERFKRAVDVYVESQGLSIFLNSKDKLLRLYMIDTPKEQIIKDLKLEGIENLVYGEEPAKHPVPSLTVGCHLAYWPDWMNFYLGRSDLYKKDFPTEKSLIDYFGDTTVEARE